MSALDIPSAAAYIAITCAVAIVWTIFTFLIRALLRTKVNGPFGLDDTACLIATILGVGQSAATLVAIHFGLGYHAYYLSTFSFEQVFLCLWVSEQLYILSEGAALLSISFLICRIALSKTHRRICFAVGYLTVSWALSSWLLHIFKCPLPRPWDIFNTDKCLDRVAVRLSITICAALLEVTNVIIAIYVVWNVQMSRRPKVAVMIAFLLRLLVLPTMFLRFNFFASVVHDDDETYARTDVTIITQVATHLSIILATVPCAKPFFVVFDGGVFRSPHDQRSTTLSNPSGGLRRTGPGDGSRADSNTALELAERAAAQPTWDRRTTFARPSISALEPPQRVLTSKKSSKPVVMKLPPLIWNRKKTLTRGEETPTPNNHPQHKPSTSSRSDPWSKSSSSRSSHTLLQQYALHDLSRPSVQNRGDSRHFGRTISQDSLRTSIRDIQAPVLRPDQAETTTVIAHDPDASKRGMASIADAREGAGGERPSGFIELRKEVVVTYEDAEQS
ncbi:hypothetical protein BST61_g11376 [Cercospora zeina]